VGFGFEAPFHFGIGLRWRVLVCHFPYRKGKDMATMIQKLVALVAAQNKSGMVISVVGLCEADEKGVQEVKIVKTSKNAKPYKLMQKHGLVEVWMGDVHYIRQDEPFHTVEKRKEEKFNFLISSASEYFQLIDFGVPPHRAENILMAAEKKGM